MAVNGLDTSQGEKLTLSQHFCIFMWCVLNFEHNEVKCLPCPSLHYLPNHFSLSYPTYWTDGSIDLSINKSIVAGILHFFAFVNSMLSKGAFTYSESEFIPIFCECEKVN